MEGHRASITEDYQVLKEIVLDKKRKDLLHDWVTDKIKNTYVKINPRYADCEYEYQGWIK